jgi:hypothetical protein
MRFSTTYIYTSLLYVSKALILIQTQGPDSTFHVFAHRNSTYHPSKQFLCLESGLLFTIQQLLLSP